MPATSTPTGFAALRAELQHELVLRYPPQIRRMRWARAEIEAHQRRELRVLLEHAVTHSPFHARRLAGVDVGGVEPSDLSALPVMTKADMMAELGEVFSDRGLTSALVEDALARTGTEPVPILGEYVAFASGGSSGRRGVFVYDRPAMLQFVGSITRSLAARLMGGGAPPGGLPIVIIGASSAVHQTGAAPALTSGGRMPMRFVPVPVTTPVPELVERLNAIRPPMLYGYPTMLALLAGEQRAGRLRIAPTAVTSTSEQLTPDLRAAISAGFGAPVIDNYGSTEGLVGVSQPDDGAITFAEDGCIIELVDAHNQPVPVGIPSEKVLVTNLSNRLQPLIRYELTDSFVRQPAVPEHGHLRATVQGRVDDEFCYGTVRVHPLVIRSVLVRSPEISEYQVRQTAAGIDVRAVAPSTLDVAGLRRRLAGALAAAGLSRPAVDVHPTSRLDRNPDTGKLRRFVPLR